MEENVTVHEEVDTTNEEYDPTVGGEEETITEKVVDETSSEEVSEETGVSTGGEITEKDYTISDEGHLLTANRQKMVDMFVKSFGFKSAGGWTNQQLFERCKALKNLEDKDLKDLRDEDRDLFDLVLDSIDNKREFEVVGKKEVKAPPVEKAKKGKTPKAAGTASPSTPHAATRDRFNCRLDSEGAKINALMEDGVFRSIKEMAEALGLSLDRVKKHCVYWSKDSSERLIKKVFTSRMEGGEAQYTYDMTKIGENKEEKTTEAE